MGARSSPAEAPDGVNAAKDVSSRVGNVSFPDVCKGRRVGEDVDRLLQLRQILGTDQHRGRATVAGDDDPLVLLLDTVDNLAEVVANRPQGLCAHGHNCGASMRESLATFDTSL